jgi:PKD repeat protein
MKPSILQLSQHEHSGKIRPHRHTSYAGLVFILLVVGVLLLGSSWAAQAAPPAVNPQAGSLGLSGTVRGPAPSTSATITSPQNGSHTRAIPVTVAGTCPVNTFVSITKNAVFAGVTPCLDDGTYSLLVDLFDGANILLAQVTDVLGQGGPNSSPITVYYDAPSLTIPGGAVGKQLFLEVTTTVLAGDPNQTVRRSATIVGGTAPYAASWDWGDGQTSLSSQINDGALSADHTYTRPGTYRVTLKVTDSLGNTAFIQIVTVINGPVEKLGTTNGLGLGALPGSLVTAWPLYGLALLMVLFFWLGERRATHKLRRLRQQALS